MISNRISDLFKWFYLTISRAYNTLIFWKNICYKDGADCIDYSIAVLVFLYPLYQYLLSSQIGITADGLESFVLKAFLISIPLLVSRASALFLFARVAPVLSTLLFFSGLAVFPISLMSDSRLKLLLSNFHPLIWIVLLCLTYHTLHILRTIAKCRSKGINYKEKGTV